MKSLEDIENTYKKHIEEHKKLFDAEVRRAREDREWEDFKRLPPLQKLEAFLKKVEESKTVDKSEKE